MTVGRDSSNSIGTAIMPFSRKFYGQITALRPQVAVENRFARGSPLSNPY
jgi:hypothetical protein